MLIFHNDNIVFGESILNDSISIIVFKTASKYVGYNMTTEDIVTCIINFFIIFIGSCVIGYTFGILTALIYKCIDFKKHIVISVGFFVIMIYIPFLVSEILQLSGVVSILFSGKLLIRVLL